MRKVNPSLLQTDDWWMSSLGPWWPMCSLLHTAGIHLTWLDCFPTLFWLYVISLHITWDTLWHRQTQGPHTFVTFNHMRDHQHLVLWTSHPCWIKSWWVEKQQLANKSRLKPRFLSCSWAFGYNMDTTQFRYKLYINTFTIKKMHAEHFLISFLLEPYNVMVSDS